MPREIPPTPTAVTVVPAKPTAGDPVVVANDRLVALWVGSKRSEHTRRAYRRWARDFLQFAATAQPAGYASAPVWFGHVTLETCQAWAKSLQGAPNSQAQGVAALRSLYAFAVSSGLLPLNPMASVPMPAAEDQRIERTLTQEQVKAILGADTAYRPLLSFLYFTGARAQEAAKLRKEDFVERANGTAQVKLTGKGKKTRFVPLSVQAWEALRSTVSITTPGLRVFPITAGRISNIVVEVGEKAGIPGISAHWLRHAYATHYMERGGRLETLQKRLGHSSLATTGAYLHVHPDTDDALELP